MKCLFHGDDCWLDHFSPKEAECTGRTDKLLLQKALDFIFTVTGENCLLKATPEGWELESRIPTSQVNITIPRTEWIDYQCEGKETYLRAEDVIRYLRGIKGDVWVEFEDDDTVIRSKHDGEILRKFKSPGNEKAFEKEWKGWTYEEPKTSMILDGETVKKFLKLKGDVWIAFVVSKGGHGLIAIKDGKGVSEFTENLTLPLEVKFINLEEAKTLFRKVPNVPVTVGFTPDKPWVIGRFTMGKNIDCRFAQASIDSWASKEDLEKATKALEDIVSGAPPPAPPPEEPEVSEEPIPAGQDPAKIVEGMNLVWNAEDYFAIKETVHWSGYAVPKPDKKAEFESMIKSMMGMKALWEKDGKYVIAWIEPEKVSAMIARYVGVTPVGKCLYHGDVCWLDEIDAKVDDGKKALDHIGKASWSVSETEEHLTEAHTILSEDPQLSEALGYLENAIANWFPEKIDSWLTKAEELLEGVGFDAYLASPLTDIGNASPTANLAVPVEVVYEDIDAARKIDIKEVEERLVEFIRGVEETYDTEEFKKFAEKMALFHHYSFHNVMLIMVQFPKATRVAGFRAWKKMGRSVKGGEKGIQILCPRWFKQKEEVQVTDEEGRPAFDERGKPIMKEKEVEHIYFVPGYVFDVSQTTGPPLPTLDTLPHGEDVMDYYSRLEDFAKTKLNLDVRFADIGPDGYTTKKEIVLSNKLVGIQKASVLIHELGHQLLGHLTQHKPRPYKELEAESAVYLVTTILDVSHEGSKFYVAATTRKPREVMDSLTKVHQIVQQLLDVMTIAEPPEEAYPVCPTNGEGVSSRKVAIATCLYHGEECWLDAKEMPDKEREIQERFDRLYKVTEEQDRLNIGLIRFLNDDTDERWVPLHMIDNANAVILGISRNRGRPKLIVNEGYVGDKLESLMGKWTTVRLRDAKQGNAQIQIEVETPWNEVADWLKEMQQDLEDRLEDLRWDYEAEKIPKLWYDEGGQRIKEEMEFLAELMQKVGRKMRPRILILIEK